MSYSESTNSHSKVCLKCFLDSEKRQFLCPRNISTQQLLEVLHRTFGQSVKVKSYEDQYGKLVVVLNDDFDLQKVLSRHESNSDRNQSPSSARLAITLHLKPKRQSGENSGFSNGSSSPAPQGEGHLPSNHPFRSSTNEIDSVTSKGSTETPPLRTPPPSPGHSPSSSPRSSLNFPTPPLRTPPPSPGSSRKNSDAQLLNNSEFSISSNHHFLPINELSEQTEKVTMTLTPPLRTPPPSPPSSNHSSRRNSIDEDPHKNYPKRRKSSSPPSFLELTLNNSKNNSSGKDYQGFQWKKGQLLGSDYEGAFGKVYLGMNNETGELIAVKQIDLDISSDKKSNIADHQHEIDLMKNLNHPNIVRYLGTQLTDSAMYIFLEYAPGGSIRSLISKFGAFTESVARVYTKQILYGLDYLHQNGIIHRDIKGANILVDTKGTVKLADFGCAKLYAGLQSHSNFRSVLGTPYWMAPEVIRAEGYGRLADIWSLGCTIIEMLEGRPPWITDWAEPTAAMFHIASSNEIPHFHDYLSSEACDFLTKCFQRDAKSRSDAGTLLLHPWIKQSQTHEANDIIKQPFQSELEYRHVNAHAFDQLFSSLPSDLILYIFSFLSESQYPCLALVCKAWKILMEDDMIWRHKVLQSWKNSRKPDGSSWRQLHIELKRHNRIWFKDPILQKPFKGKTQHDKCINVLIANFGAKLLASGGDDKKIKVWDLKKKKSKTLKGHEGPINCLQFNDDATKIWSGSSDKSIKYWDIKSKKVVQTWNSAHVEGVTCLQYQHGKLISASEDKMVKIWDVSTNREIGALITGHSAGIRALHFVNHTIVSGSEDGTIKIFDTRMLKCTRTLKGHADGVTCIQFDDSDSRIISGSRDKTLKEFCLKTGNVLNTFRGHNDVITSVSFDQNKIISTSTDKTIRIYDRHHSSVAINLFGHTDAITCHVFNSTCIISAGKDKIIREWQTSEFSPNY